MSGTAISTPVTIGRKVRAIVKFGPATPMDGFRGGEYLEAIIDPNMVSPDGDFIRFDQRFQGGELHGWQRIDAMTVCEILSENVPDYKPVPEGYEPMEGATVTMMQVKYGE